MHGGLDVIWFSMGSAIEIHGNLAHFVAPAAEKVTHSIVPFSMGWYESLARPGKNALPGLKKHPEFKFNLPILFLGG